MKANFIQITPFMHVDNLETALAFFHDVLGFETVVHVHDYAYVQRETLGIRMMANKGSDGAPPGNRRFAYYIDVRDVDALYLELKPELDALPKGDVHGPADKDYGQRELLVLAPDGNLLAFGHAVTSTSTPGEITVKTEEDAIIAETQAFADAWSRGDAKSCASFFTEDGVRVGAMGDVQRGRVELAVAYDELLHGRFAGAKVTQDRGSVRMLGPDVAFWQGGIEITPPSGPSLKGHVVQVMKKVGTRWLILEAHPKLYPPPPK